MARIFFQRAPSGLRTVRGELIRKIQEPLKAGGFYDGIVDGIYGDQTERALLKFQESKQLPITGKVDDQTWQQLMSSPAPDLKQRCLQVTADYEGTGFTKAVGNFDGAGITWGIIGFTLFHGELEAVLKEIRAAHENVFRAAFGVLTDEIVTVLNSSLTDQMKFANRISIGTSKMKIRPEWEEAFFKLGLDPNVQAIQLERTEGFFKTALRDMERFNVLNEQGLGLCFDIAVQNGGISNTEATRIRNRINQSPPTTQQDLRIIIANVVAEGSKPAFIEDVRKRKMTFATGRGTVHGSKYDVRTWGLDDLPA